MKKNRTFKNAFSLVECVLALGLVSVSVVPMMGLLPVGLTNTHIARAQTSASNIVTAIAADMRTSDSDTTPRFAIDLLSTAEQTFYLDEFGKVGSSSDKNARYRAIITLLPVNSNLSMCKIAISWPAQASNSAAIGNIDTLIPVNRL